MVCPPVHSPAAGATVMTSYVYRDPSYTAFWKSCTPAVQWKNNSWFASNCAVVDDVFGSRENHHSHEDGLNVLYGDGHARWVFLPLVRQVQETENKDTHASCGNDVMAKGWATLDESQK